jgi:hypothetical protein
MRDSSQQSPPPGHNAHSAVGKNSTMSRREKKTEWEQLAENSLKSKHSHYNSNGHSRLDKTILFGTIKLLLFYGNVKNRKLHTHVWIQSLLGKDVLQLWYVSQMSPYSLHSTLWAPVKSSALYRKHCAIWGAAMVMFNAFLPCGAPWRQHCVLGVELRCLRTPQRTTGSSSRGCIMYYRSVSQLRSPSTPNRINDLF